MMNIKRPARRKVVPGVDQLELRQLLSVTDIHIVPSPAVPQSGLQDRMA